MALQKHTRRYQVATAQRHAAHVEQLLLHASILTLALLAAVLTLAG